jgi:hypothetical protein
VPVVDQRQPVVPIPAVQLHTTAAGDADQRQCVVDLLLLLRQLTEVGCHVPCQHVVRHELVVGSATVHLEQNVWFKY